MSDVLKFSGPKPVYAHPDIFSKHYGISDNKKIYAGIPFNIDYLENLGAEFRLNTGMIEIEKNMYLTGEVPRNNDFEKGADNLKLLAENGELLPDPLKDDNSLVFDTEKGLVVIFGCAHAGMINILDYVTKKLKKDKVYAVIGGTHLAPASDEQMDETIKALEKYDIEHIGVSHCTGLLKASLLHEKFKNKFFFASVGAEFRLGR